MNDRVVWLLIERGNVPSLKLSLNFFLFLLRFGPPARVPAGAFNFFNSLALCISKLRESLCFPPLRPGQGGLLQGCCDRVERRMRDCLRERWRRGISIHGRMLEHRDLSKWFESRVMLIGLTAWDGLARHPLPPRHFLLRKPSRGEIRARCARDRLSGKEKLADQYRWADSSLLVLFYSSISVDIEYAPSSEE